MAVVVTLSKGHDLDYVWRQVAAGASKEPRSYYIEAVEGGEPPVVGSGCRGPGTPGRSEC